jgi:hypothetical protein
MVGGAAARTLEAAKMLGGAIALYIVMAARGSGADPGGTALGGPELARSRGALRCWVRCAARRRLRGSIDCDDFQQRQCSRRFRVR